MRATLLLLPLLALAACATPRESCVNNVTGELRQTDRQIGQLQRDLARGYVLVDRERYGFRETTCVGRDDEGNRYRYDCRRPGWETVKVSVPIDRVAAETRLAALTERRNTLSTQVAPAIEACSAAYPNEA